MRWDGAQSRSQRNVLRTQAGNGTETREDSQEWEKVRGEFPAQGEQELEVLVLLNFYLFLAVLDLHCCERPFSSCRELGLLSCCWCGLRNAVASLVAEQGP